MTSKALLAIGLIAVGLLIGAVLNVALSFDGSYHLYNVLQRQQPFIVYGRYSDLLLQAPVLWLSLATSDLTALRLAFSLPYALPPVVAATWAWLLVRHQAPHLFVWPILGIGLLALPTAIYQSNETVAVAALAWPLLLSVALGLPGKSVLGAAVLAVVLVFFHPLAAQVVLVSAILAVLGERLVYRGRKRLLVWGVAGAATVAIRFAVLRSGNEVVYPFLINVITLPQARILLVSTFAAVILGVLIAWRRATTSPSTLLAQGAVMGVAAGLLFAWAASPPAWAKEVNYREYTVIFQLPLVALMAWEAWRGDPGKEAVAARGRVVVAVACLFLGVFVTQALAWNEITQQLRLRMEAARTTWPTPASVDQSGTVLATADQRGNWWVPSLSVVLGNRDVSRIVLGSEDCRQLLQGRVIKITYFDAQPADGGWFRYPDSSAGIHPTGAVPRFLQPGRLLGANRQAGGRTRTDDRLFTKQLLYL